MDSVRALLVISVASIAGMMFGSISMLFTAAFFPSAILAVRKGLIK